VACLLVICSELKLQLEFAKKQKEAADKQAARFEQQAMSLTKKYQAVDLEVYNSLQVNLLKATACFWLGPRALPVTSAISDNFGSSDTPVYRGPCSVTCTMLYLQSPCRKLNRTHVCIVWPCCTTCAVY
jgi:hypothetical protein